MKKRLVSYILITVLAFGGMLGITAVRNNGFINNVHADKTEGLSSIAFTIAKVGTYAYQADGMHDTHDNLSPNKSILDEMNNNNGLVTSISNLQTVYPGNSSGGPGAASDALKFGSSSAVGTLTLSTQHVIHKVVIRFATWSATKNSQLKVNDVAGVAVARQAYDDETFTLSTPSDSITIASLYPSSGDRRLLISRIDLYHYCSI